MIFIWSGEGGPLQYAGLFLFLLQFIGPHLYHLANELSTLNADDGNGLHRGGNNPVVFSNSHLAFAVGFFLFNICGSLLLVWFPTSGVEEDNDVAGGAAGAAAEEAPSGSPANPIVIDDDGGGINNAAGNSSNTNNTQNGNVHDTNGAAGNISNTINTQHINVHDTNEQPQSLWRDYLSSLPQTPAPHVLFLPGLLFSFLLLLPLAADYLWKDGMLRYFTDENVLWLTTTVVICHIMMAILACRMLRDVIGGGGGGEGMWTYPGNARGPTRRRRRFRKLTAGEITDIVRKVPVEEYVSPKDVHSGQCTSVSRLKRMLVNRGESEATGRCFTREELAKEIERCRKFNEECPVCAEEYAEGDVLRVSHCQHEFHLHCFDKWMYTFSTNSRPATNPTCPLCKATIE